MKFFDLELWRPIATHGPRLAMKALFFALGLFILWRVCLPSQQASWRLWLGDAHAGLANDTAFGIVFGSAMVFSVAGFAWAAGQWMRALAGLVLGAAFFVSALIGVWNLYLFQDRANGTSVIAATAATAATAGDRVKELEAEKARVDAREVQTVSLLTGQLERTADTATITRRTLSQQILDAQASAEADRTRIDADLKTARQQSAMKAEDQADAVDRRPADAEIAAALSQGKQKVERRLVGSLLDLKRSGMFELMALMFATLALASAPQPARVKVVKGDGGAEKALKILERFAGAGAFFAGIRMPWQKASPPADPPPTPEPEPDPAPEPDPQPEPRPDPQPDPQPDPPKKRRGVRTLPEPTEAELVAAGLATAPADPVL